jgi:hypothetical protein
MRPWWTLERKTEDTRTIRCFLLKFHLHSVSRNAQVASQANVPHSQQYIILHCISHALNGLTQPEIESNDDGFHKKCYQFHTTCFRRHEVLFNEHEQIFVFTFQLYFPSRETQSR